MSLFNIFIASLTSIKKMAAFRLMGMGKTMQYIFLFIFIFSFLGFYQFVFSIGEPNGPLDGLVERFNEISWLLYPFAFLLLFIIQTLATFMKISIIAAIALLVAPLMKRKAEYRFLWRTTLFANTWAFIILFISYFLFNDADLIRYSTYLLTTLFVILALRYYPKLRKVS